jgi:hypothetical protein
MGMRLRWKMIVLYKRIEGATRVGFPKKQLKKGTTSSNGGCRIVGWDTHDSSHRPLSFSSSSPSSFSYSPSYFFSSP